MICRPFAVIVWFQPKHQQQRRICPEVQRIIDTIKQQQQQQSKGNTTRES
jgi:hypothetical protein